MNYIDFHSQWLPMGCFSIHQIYAWRPTFNRLNLNNWIKKGFIIKLRNEWYAFKECLSQPDFHQYVANRIYRPSYISLQYALAHYGMIPEEIMTVTSVSSLKTASFENALGRFSYNKVKPELMFGYEPKITANGRAIMFATPEKALLDLLYLSPFYKTEADMSELRLDEDFMEEDFNPTLFREYCRRIDKPSLTSRTELLLATYNL